MTAGPWTMKNFLYSLLLSWLETMVLLFCVNTYGTRFVRLNYFVVVGKSWNFDFLVGKIGWKFLRLILIIVFPIAGLIIRQNSTAIVHVGSVVRHPVIVLWTVKCKLSTCCVQLIFVYFCMEFFSFPSHKELNTWQRASTSYLNDSARETE